LQSLSIQELLKWSLMESDNNAADIILHLIGGPEAATNLMKQAGCPEAITIGASENDLHSRPDLILLNKATPIAMAALFHRFNTEIRHRSSSFAEIAAMLEQCRTGADRLAMPLSHAKAVIGHKTGTGFTTPLGGITALNDCGYVNLPDGRHYSIAVFIADSPYSTQATAKIIAGISSIVLSVLSPSSTQNRNL
ncbi:MAG: serine hydrolase, partial [Muribaculaceae bacterium]|nr:serine hydrolase [Muribaculaceae bacterium]